MDMPKSVKDEMSQYSIPEQSGSKVWNAFVKMSDLSIKWYKENEGRFKEKNMSREDVLKEWALLICGRKGE